MKQNENYEKKYKEALERAEKIKQDINNIGCSMDKDMLDIIFPELQESKDERIRKWLVEQLHNGVFNVDEYPKYALKAVHWLEKQKPTEGIKGNLEEIPSNSPKQELEQAAEAYSAKRVGGIILDDEVNAFKAGAEWQKKQGILNEEVTFGCISKYVTITVQQLIDYYIDTECAECADECGF